jgi:hypothetical protein
MPPALFRARADCELQKPNEPLSFQFQTPRTADTRYIALNCDRGHNEQSETGIRFLKLRCQGVKKMLTLAKSVVAVFLIFAFGLTNIDHAKAQPPDPCFDWAEWGQ